MVSAFFYFLSVVFLLTLNPDSYHEGFLLSYGEMTHRGLTPNLDYISLWGPFLPYLLSIPMYFMNNLIALRVFGYLCICLASYILYRINIRNTSRSNSLLISAVWLISYPPFSMLSCSKRCATTLWPGGSSAWPNIYGILLILLSAYILVFTITKPQNLINFFLVFVSGSFAVLSVFIRIDFIFAYTAIVLFVYWVKKSGKLFFIFVTPFLIVFCYILYNRSSSFINSWFEQTFTTLFSEPFTNGVPIYSATGVLRSLLFIFLLFSLYVTFILIINFKSLLFKNKFINFSSLFVLIYLTISFLYNIEIITNNPLNKLYPWFNGVNSKFGLGYIAISLITLVPLTLMNIKKQKINKNKNLQFSLSAFLAFGTLPLNHSFSVDYIWLNSVFLISYTLLSLSEVLKLRLIHIVLPSLIFCVAVYFYGFANLYQSQFYSYDATALKFMRTTNIEAGKKLDQEMELITKIPVGSKFQNQCLSPFYLVNERKLVNATKLLHWSDNYLYKKENQMVSNSWVLACNVTKDRLSEVYDSEYYYVENKDDSISLIYKFVK